MRPKKATTSYSSTKQFRLLKVGQEFTSKNHGKLVKCRGNVAMTPKGQVVKITPHEFVTISS